MDSTTKDFKGKHILVVGASSKTGKALFSFLSAKKEIQYSLSDIKKDETIEKIASQSSHPPKNIYWGEQTFSQLKDIDHIVIAPGVPRSIPLLQEASKRKIPVDSEIAFAFYWLKDKNIKTIGITGTDGKSTTSAMTHYLLSQKYQTHLLGNFGEPLIGAIDKIQDGDYVVLELSSYQLEDGEKYYLNGATILNIAPDHLNRYPSMKEYREAKEKIFYNQKETDIALIPKDSEFYSRWMSLTKAKCFSFSTSQEATLFLQKDKIYYEDQLLFSISDTRLIGKHNLENWMVACGFALFFGVPKEKISAAIPNFRGLEHRIEWVDTINGIRFINDSKATTVQAVIRALESISSPLILILGGSDKNLDFRELNPFLHRFIKKIICYGETGKKIADALSFPHKEIIFSFDKAFELAVQAATSGDTILLSPGCASFDQFQSFEERGKRFKELVKHYAQTTL